MNHDDDPNGLSYKSSGVDVEAADKFVARIATLAKATHNNVDVVTSTAYAGLVKPDLSNMNAPLIAATCDGVGTKLVVARDAGRYEGLGQDLVAMNVNDLLPAGARPLLFLDYLATGKLDAEQLESIVASIAAACKEVGCALVGGETAEMPDVYQKGDFDLAGFAVGTVDQTKVPNPATMAAGDILLALPSTGVHSNGLSLARKALFEKGGLSLDETPDELTETVADALLRPTALYVKQTLGLLAHTSFKAAAHITGGGLLGLGKKLLKPGLAMSIDPTTYKRPSVFNLIQRCGQITEQEMASTFNMGLGFLVVLSPEQADIALSLPDSEWLKVGAITAGEGVDLGYART